MNNLEIVKLKEDLINRLNDSELPVIVKQYILIDIQGIFSDLIPGILEYEKQGLLEGCD